jgi:hypothetical protein
MIRFLTPNGVMSRGFGLVTFGRVEFGFVIMIPKSSVLFPIVILPPILLFPHLIDC